jgi:hypothetical protein
MQPLEQSFSMRVIFKRRVNPLALGDCPAIPANVEALERDDVLNITQPKIRMTQCGVHHLTRIRPNNCAFKDAFFGSITSLAQIDCNVQSISASIEGSLPENTASWQAKSERSSCHESLKSFRATQREAYAENSISSGITG